MIVQVRHSANSGNTPIALANGELALNVVDQLLYHRHANGSIGIIANGASLLTFSIAQVSSNLNQVPANTNPFKITYNNNDLLIGTEHILGNSRVTVLSNGWYSIIAIGNYNKTSGGTTLRYADCWLRKNNVNVQGTTTRIPIPIAGMDIPMALHSTLRLNANDYIELLQTVDSTSGSPGLRGDATALDAAPPLLSIKLSITKLAN